MALLLQKENIKYWLFGVQKILKLSTKINFEKGNILPMQYYNSLPNMAAYYYVAGRHHKRRPPVG